MTIRWFVRIAVTSSLLISAVLLTQVGHAALTDSPVGTSDPVPATLVASDSGAQTTLVSRFGNSFEIHYSTSYGSVVLSGTLDGWSAEFLARLEGYADVFRMTMGSDLEPAAQGPGSWPPSWTVTVRFGEFGTLIYAIGTSAGTVTPLSSTVQDCAALTESPLYRALLEIYENLPRIVMPDEDRALTDTVSGLFVLPTQLEEDCWNYAPVTDGSKVVECYQNLDQCERMCNERYGGCGDDVPFTDQLKCALCRGLCRAEFAKCLIEAITIDKKGPKPKLS